MNWIKKFTSAHYDGGRKRCKKYCTLLSVNSFIESGQKNALSSQRRTCPSVPT